MDTMEATIQNILLAATEQGPARHNLKKHMKYTEV